MTTRSALTRLVIYAVLGCAFFMPCVSRAADIYVSERGDDANAGTTIENPLLTLQKADSLVKPGETVWVMPGTYRNRLKDEGGGTSSLLTIKTSGTKDAWITWRAYKNAKPELIAQGCWSAIAINASYIVIDGLTVTGNNDNVRQIDAEVNAEVDAIKTAAAFETADGKGKTIDESVAPDAKLSSKEAAKAVPAARPKPIGAHPPSPLYNGGCIQANSRGLRPEQVQHHMIIRNCTLRKGGGGVGMLGVDYFTVENCDVYENAWYTRYGSSGISMLGGNMFDNEPGYHVIIRNNRVWNNKCLVRCLGTDCFSDGNGIILDSLGDYAGDALIEGNVCFDNGGAGIHVFKSRKAHIDVIGNTLWRNQQMWNLYDMGCHSAVNVRFFNNIVYAERRKQVNGKPVDSVVYDYNIYYGSDQVAARGAHDLAVDPMFVMASTNPNVADFRLKPGSAAIDSGSPELAAKTDHDGNPRVLGSGIDRGAYEAAAKQAN